MSANNFRTVVVFALAVLVGQQCATNASLGSIRAKLTSIQASVAE